MHGLLQQLDTLNAAHAPEHLEMFESFKKAGTDAYNAAANSEFALHQQSRATDQEVILYEYSKREKKEDDLNLLLMSTGIRAKSDELLKVMIQSPTIKQIIMQNWYINRPITAEIQKDIFAKMMADKKADRGK